jgi:hypothetical protein
MKTYIISRDRIPIPGICTVLGGGMNSSNPLLTGIWSLGKNPYAQLQFSEMMYFFSMWGGALPGFDAMGFSFFPR